MKVLYSIWVKKITGSAFFYCSQLSYVSIPSSVSDIEIDAFTSCSELSSIIIPSNVGRLDNPFRNCYKLSLVIFLGESISGSSDVFPGCSKLTEVHVLPSYGSDSFCEILPVKNCINTGSCGASTIYIFDNCTTTADETTTINEETKTIN